MRLRSMGTSSPARHADVMRTSPESTTAGVERGLAALPEVDSDTVLFSGAIFSGSQKRLGSLTITAWNADDLGTFTRLSP